MIDSLNFLRFLFLLGCGLLAPGWLLGRALRTPGGPAGALLGSAALLVNLLLLLDGLGIRLDFARLALALILLCAGLALVAKLRSPRPAAAAPASARPRWRWQPFHWLLLPALIGVAAIVVRATLDPLSGWDCGFRWDFLAREIARTGTMGFYPAVTADDFLHYSWCDGIAPLVSSLYVWSYFSLGRIEAWATAPVVIAQGLLVFHVVGKLATLRAGPAAGAAACALLATSALLLWSVAMGQETALTALSVVALFWFIERGRTTAQVGWMIWAGVAAGIGALAREYGLCFPALGLLALAFWRQPRRHYFAFLGAAALVALPWYVRVWVKTGHPLYCFELGSLFPLNPVHVELTHLVLHDLSLARHPQLLAPLPGLVALLAGVPLMLGLAVGVARWRDYGPWLAALLALFFLWLWSFGLTSGGALYSTRVLSPMVGLGAVLGGIWLAKAAMARRAWIMALALGGLAVHASATALYLPIDARPHWWRDPPLAWRTFSQLSDQWSHHPRWQAIATAAEGRKILVTDPGLYAILANSGARTVPLFSPDVRFLFDAEPATLADDAARLRAEGFRFVILPAEKSSFMGKLLAVHPFFPALQAQTKSVPASRLYQLYDLYPPEQRYDGK